MYMSYFELSYDQFKFFLFTCYIDGIFQNKFPFKDNKVLFYLILSGTDGNESVIFLVEANLLTAACDTSRKCQKKGLWGCGWVYTSINACTCNHTTKEPHINQVPFSLLILSYQEHSNNCFTYTCSTMYHLFNY